MPRFGTLRSRALRLLFVFLVAAALTPQALAQVPVTPTLTPLSDTHASEDALKFPRGRFGTAINGQTYQAHALTTFNGYQYAIFYADPGVVALSRRKLPDGPWQVIRFDDYQIGDHRDTHNVAVLGISHPDGSIHLSFDHHASPLHYRRSKPGLATAPESADWSADSFEAVTDELQPGTPLKSITYPMFFNRPDGGLQLIYRVGSSGSGNWFLTNFDAAVGHWTEPAMLFSRVGRFENSASRCAYPEPLRYGPGGRLHVTWTWRERPKGGPRDLRTNHDIGYAYSDDFGQTWLNSAGETVAKLGESAITVASPGTTVALTPFLHGQMNTVSLEIDGRGRPHVMSWRLPPSEPRPDGVDLNAWRYYHHWRDSEGNWHENGPLPFVGRKPQIAVDPQGNVYVIHVRSEDRAYHDLDPGGTLTVSTATEASGWTDWTTAWQATWTGVGEPLYDVNRWKTEGVLSIYLQEKPTDRGKPSPLHVVDLKP